MQLKDVKAIVTGAGAGHGRALRAAPRRGRRAGRRGRHRRGSARASCPPGVHKRKLDVRRESDCVEFAAWAREAMGGLNSLVNNAGIIRDGLLVRQRQDHGRDQEDDRRGLAAPCST